MGPCFCISTLHIGHIESKPQAMNVTERSRAPLLADVVMESYAGDPRLDLMTEHLSLSRCSNMKRQAGMRRVAANEGSSKWKER